VGTHARLLGGAAAYAVTGVAFGLLFVTATSRLLQLGSAGSQAAERQPASAEPVFAQGQELGAQLEQELRQDPEEPEVRRSALQQLPPPHPHPNPYLQQKQQQGLPAASNTCTLHLSEADRQLVLQGMEGLAASLCRTPGSGGQEVPAVVQGVPALQLVDERWGRQSSSNVPGGRRRAEEE